MKELDIYYFVNFHTSKEEISSMFSKSIIKEYKDKNISAEDYWDIFNEDYLNQSGVDEIFDKVNFSYELNKDLKINEIKRKVNKI